MNGKRLLNCLGLVLMLVLLTGVSGCNRKTTTEIEPMEPEESSAISFDIIGGKDVMPITGYYGPRALEWSEDGMAFPESLNEEIYQLMEDCGINIMAYSVTEATTVNDLVQKMLDLGAAHGIGIFVNDNRIVQSYGENMLTLEEMAEIMSEYMNHPGYAGQYLVDEPGTAKYTLSNGHEMSNYVEIYDKLTRQMKVFTYFNILPITDMERKTEYLSYVKEYLETVQPEYLSYDKYPFEKSNVGKEDCYFWNLALMREYALEYQIPLWTYMQCGDQWTLTTDTESYWPNEKQFNWQVNVNLAFGVQGIQYYSLLEYPLSAISQSERFDTYRSGLIGVQGNKTQWYYYAQKMNQHIAAIDHVLMNSVSKGVIASGEKAEKATSLCSEKTIINETSWRELKDVDGEALIGCFNYQGKTALYVVNYSTLYAQNIKLTFADAYHVTVFQQAETSYFHTKELTLDMPAGDGVLIVFEH